MRVCPVCQRPNVINLSSHLSMVHGLNGHERTPHLKNAVLCSTTTMSPAVQTLRKKSEKAISFPDQTLGMNRSTTRIETGSSESMNARQSAVMCSNARILQLNDKPGPLLVHLNQIQWSMVNETFRESSCGGNLPQGWFIWRIYVIKTNGNYIPVLLKDPFSSKTMFYSVIEDWLLCTCSVYKQQKQRN